MYLKEKLFNAFSAMTILKITNITNKIKHNIKLYGAEDNFFLLGIFLQWKG
jgi:hypothetical protein